MTYKVVWDIQAIASLQRIFDFNNDQEGLINTVTRVNIELGSVPLEVGESREVGRRVLFKYPLVVHYDVVERIKSVSIFHVGLTRR